MISVQGASSLTLYAVVIVAVVQDIRHRKISNRLILVGFILSLIFGTAGGMSRIVTVLLNSLFPVIVLYLLYLIGVLGAGDVKLFSIIGGFTNFKTLTDCMLAALVAGAFFALVRLLYRRTLVASLLRVRTYTQDLLAGKFFSYRKEWADEQDLMHFSVFILIGLVIAQSV